jgi:23S rRNA (guanosine2251-2'-O)-methyltransferase
MLDKLVGSVPHQGIVAEIAPFDFVGLPEMLDYAKAAGRPPLLVALDQIQDPHNLGSLVRSSLALGAHGIIMPKDRSCGVTPSVVKSSAGAAASLPLARVTNLRRTLEDAKDAGLWIVGACATGEGVIWEHDFTQGTVLVIGSEGRGLRRTVQAACDYLVRIPLGAEMASLNASVAGAICLYEAASQRLQGPT